MMNEYTPIQHESSHRLSQKKLGDGCSILLVVNSFPVAGRLLRVCFVLFVLGRRVELIT